MSNNNARVGPDSITPKEKGHSKHDSRENNPLTINVLCGNKPRRHLLDFFLTDETAAEKAPLPKTVIVEETGLSRTSVVNNMDLLVKFGIAEDVGSEGQPRYAPNTESETFQLAQEFNNALFAAHQSSDDEDE